jgi:5-methyltetrahydrofolate--homocysteine methyltransferase
MQTLLDVLPKKILILDGAIGTRLLESSENNSIIVDLLNLEKPHLVSEIHENYLKSGADIIKTNTFLANSISLRQYQAEHLVLKINEAAIKLAQAACLKYQSMDKPRFVAGVMGPTHLSISKEPKFKTEIYQAYHEQAQIFMDQMEN